MTSAQNKALTPREETPSASSELFAFYKGSVAAANRFFPGAGARLRFASKDADTLQLPGLPVGLIGGGDTVIVVYKGATVFRGTAERRTRRYGRGDDAVEDVVCCGPWSKMARLVYRQYWAGENGFFQSSRIVLNQHQTNSASDADNGKPQNLNSELREIANHAATACGYQCGVNDVSVSAQYLPFDEVRDITIADAIRRELRFFPRTVVYFDYSTTPPTLKIKRQSGSTDASYIASIPMASRRREYVDHPITGVYLEIETIADGYRSISHQSSGSTSPGNPNCLYATIQLAGASGSTVTQSFKSVTENIPSSLNDVAWWLAKHPRLHGVATSQIQITNGARSDSGETVQYPRISAATAGELEAAGLKCRVVEFTCEATITTAEEVEEKIYLSMNFLTTNATTKTYTWVVESSSTAGETCPNGLADAIRYDRSGILRGERIVMRLGDTLPTLGDCCDGIYLQSYEVDCSTLMAELNFGAPDYLAPEDMAALLSGFRNKRRPSTAYSRATGKPADDNTDKTELGSIPPLSSTEFKPGKKSKTTIGSSAASPTTGTFSFDSAALSSSETIAVKTISAGSSGQQASTAKILSTKNVTITQKPIAAGSGIKVTESGGKIIISTVGGEAVSTSGYTGERSILADADYDTSSHALRRRYITEKWSNGVLTSQELGPWEPYHYAVEETV